MDFTNINDPAGVTALLESLRSSQAWADIQENQPSASVSAAIVGKLKEPTLSDEHASSEGSSSTSVADLLARLQNPRPTPVQQTPPEILQQIAPTPNVEDAERFLSDSFPSRVEKRNSNTRHLSFQQSLPVLAQLSENTECIHVISKMRREQDELERQLFEERSDITIAQQEKVKAAVTKANIIGAGISEREAKSMTQSFEKELESFDKNRVLPAWDGLIAQQQVTLERLGAPTMFITKEKLDRDRQQRIIQVLEGIVGGER